MKKTKFDPNRIPKFKDLAECLADHLIPYSFSVRCVGTEATALSKPDPVARSCAWRGSFRSLKRALRGGVRSSMARNMGRRRPRARDRLWLGRGGFGYGHGRGGEDGLD